MSMGVLVVMGMAVCLFPMLMNMLVFMLVFMRVGVLVCVFPVSHVRPPSWHDKYVAEINHGWRSSQMLHCRRNRSLRTHSAMFKNGIEK